jgi:hypothetical protein
MLCPTPLDQLLDSKGRPSFLWDCDLTLDELRALLSSEDLEVRAYWLGTVMRQAKPDDALQLASPAEMRAVWDAVLPYLGGKRAFWAWYLEEMRVRGR